MRKPENLYVIIPREITWRILAAWEGRDDRSFLGFLRSFLLAIGNCDVTGIFAEPEARLGSHVGNEGSSRWFLQPIWRTRGDAAASRAGSIEEVQRIRSHSYFGSQEGFAHFAVQHVVPAIIRHKRRHFLHCQYLQGIRKLDAGGSRFRDCGTRSGAFINAHMFRHKYIYILSEARKILLVWKNSKISLNILLI